MLEKEIDKNLESRISELETVHSLTRSYVMNHRKEIDELKESVKALGSFSNEHAESIVENMDELNELKEIILLDKETAEKECAISIIDLIVSQSDSNKDEIAELKETNKTRKRENTLLQTQIDELEKKSEWNGKQIVHVFDSLIEKHSMIAELGKYRKADELEIVANTEDITELKEVCGKINDQKNTNKEVLRDLIEYFFPKEWKTRLRLYEKLGGFKRVNFGEDGVLITKDDLESPETFKPKFDEMLEKGSEKKEPETFQTSSESSYYKWKLKQKKDSEGSEKKEDLCDMCDNKGDCELTPTENCWNLTRKLPMLKDTEGSQFRKDGTRIGELMLEEKIKYEQDHPDEFDIKDSEEKQWSPLLKRFIRKPVVRPSDSEKKELDCDDCKHQRDGEGWCLEDVGECNDFEKFEPKDSEKKECEHKNTVSSSDPTIWYICQDCGAWLDNEFKVITKERHKKIVKFITGKDSEGEKELGEDKKNRIQTDDKRRDSSPNDSKQPEPIKTCSNCGNIDEFVNNPCKNCNNFYSKWIPIPEESIKDIYREYYQINEKPEEPICADCEGVYKDGIIRDVACDKRCEKPVEPKYPYIIEYHGCNWDTFYDGEKYDVVKREDIKENLDDLKKITYWHDIERKAVEKFEKWKEKWGDYGIE